MALLPALNPTPGGDKFQDLYDKYEQLRQTINAILGGGNEGESVRKVTGTDFDYEFFTPFESDVLFKKVDIGTWNIPGGLSISVNHGLDFTKIIGVISVSITDDAEAIKRSIYHAPPSFDNVAGRFTCHSSQVTINIRSGSVFDSSEFNSTTINRGHIILAYTA